MTREEPNAADCGVARKTRHVRVRPSVLPRTALTVAALRHLTDQDLKDIGVLLGHRRIMLAAIGDLAGAPPAVPKPVAAAEPKAQDAAERRQVTVMFSDLVGSTALAARMDPEDLREIISAYQKCVAETVGRFGGFVAKYMGDGVLVYFGYPQAHEDDAERAVRAGLELIASGGRAEVQCPTPNACRHCHGAGRCRRLDRIGFGSGACGCRRDAEPCGAPARDCRAKHGRDRRDHTKTARQFVRAAGPRGQGTQGHRRARAGLGAHYGQARSRAASRRCTGQQ